MNSLSEQNLDEVWGVLLSAAVKTQDSMMLQPRFLCICEANCYCKSCELVLAASSCGI